MPTPGCGPGCRQRSASRPATNASSGTRLLKRLKPLASRALTARLATRRRDWPKKGRGPMRAIQVQQDLTVRPSEVETPRPGPGDALIRIHAAGVCGTDLHIVDGMIKPDAYP